MHEICAWKIKIYEGMYNIRETAKTALSSCKIDKYEHLTGNEIFFYQSQMIEQAKSKYSPLETAF